VLLLPALFATTGLSEVVTFFEFFELLFEIHGAPIIGDSDKAVGNVPSSATRVPAAGIESATCVRHACHR
jgi:hypothetical protein